MQDVTARAGNFGSCVHTYNIYGDIIRNTQAYNRYINTYVWLSSREASDARDQSVSSFSTYYNYGIQKE